MILILKFPEKDQRYEDIRYVEIDYQERFQKVAKNILKLCPHLDDEAKKDIIEKMENFFDMHWDHPSGIFRVENGEIERYKYSGSGYWESYQLSMIFDDLGLFERFTEELELDNIFLSMLEGGLKAECKSLLDIPYSSGKVIKAISICDNFKPTYLLQDILKKTVKGDLKKIENEILKEFFHYDEDDIVVILHPYVVKAALLDGGVTREFSKEDYYNWKSERKILDYLSEVTDFNPKELLTAIKRRLFERSF